MKQKSTRATQRKPTSAQAPRARKFLASVGGPARTTAERADALRIDLTQARAALMSAVLAIEHKGSILDEVATMLRMSGLRAIERAWAVVEGMSS